jgi:hypothetical protein
MPLPNFWKKKECQPGSSARLLEEKHRAARPSTAFVSLQKKMKSDYLGEILIIIDRIVWVWPMGREMQPNFF